jgi:ATP/maltotriose-dependent transcriptional regulator MalT
MQAAQEGLDIANQIGVAQVQWQAYFSLGFVSALRGDYNSAIGLLKNAHEKGAMSGYLFFDAMALATLAAVYTNISTQLDDVAHEYEAQAQAIMQHPMFRKWAGATAWIEIGSAALEMDNLDKAEEFFNMGLTTPSTEWLVQKPRYMVGLALVAVKRGKLEEAERLADEARQYAEERGMKVLYPLIAFAQAQVSAAKGEMEVALAQFGEAETQAKEMQMRPFIWQSQVGAAQVLATCGRRAEAASKLAEARAVIDEMAALFTDDDLRAAFVKDKVRKLES